MVASKKHLFQDSKAVMGYLRARYGIPQSMFEEIRLTLALDALSEGENLGFNRFYTAVVIALRRAANFGPKRTKRVLAELDHICGEIIAGKKTWEDTMRMCDEETGFIIRRGEDGDWLCEYKTDEEKKSGELMS